jgi:hypothetical protein
MRSASSFSVRRSGLGIGWRRLRQPDRLGQPHQHTQRRSQIVRDRRQQRIAQALGFHLQQRRLRHLDIVHALDGDRHQTGKGLELPARSGPCTRSGSRGAMASTPRVRIGALSGR